MQKKKSAFRLAAEHMLVAIMLLLSSMFVPGIIAGSWFVERGIDSSLEWFSPDEGTITEVEEAPTNRLGRFRDWASERVEGVQSLTYDGFRGLVGAGINGAIFVGATLLLLGGSVASAYWSLRLIAEGMVDLATSPVRKTSS